MSGRVRVGAIKASNLGNLVKRKRSASQDQIIQQLKLSDLRKPLQDSKYAVKRLDPEYQKPHHYDMDQYGGIWYCMPMMQIWYDSFEIQMAVAALIFANFITSAAASQLIDDQSESTVLIFKAFEYFFTYIFTLELVINMYAHGWGFWIGEQYGWNLFDFIVVSVSLLSLVAENLPGISVLRLLRAFRVFRLFKRLKSLRQIIKALEASIPGVANAFAILLLVIGIYAILGVEFFQKSSPEYFSSFAKSMFSLFQVMTGESWAEAVARPIMDGMAPNCIIEYYAPMTHPDEGSIRYSWETPGRYSARMDVGDDHPDYKKHYAGMRSHYVGTFNCFVDDAALLKNDGKVAACNKAHIQRIRETCKGVPRFQTTDDWLFADDKNTAEYDAKKGDTWSQTPGGKLKYANLLGEPKGALIHKNQSYIDTSKPFRLSDPTILADPTAAGMDPNKGNPDRFGYSGLTWKKATLWMRPANAATGYSTKVYMEGLVKKGVEGKDGNPEACDAAWEGASPNNMCEPDGKLHWYTYEDYVRIYKNHDYCGRTTSDADGVHKKPKYGGPPNTKIPEGEIMGRINKITGYYPEVMHPTGDCASTVTQIVGDRSEKVTRQYNHKTAILYATADQATLAAINQFDVDGDGNLNNYTDPRAVGKTDCSTSADCSATDSKTYQGLAGYADSPFPNAVGVKNEEIRGYQYRQIPCPLYMQKDPPIVKEARCYNYYQGQGAEECVNNCLPQELGSIYFVTFILFCGYMLVNVAISIVIEKMMEKDDGDEHPERIYEILRVPTASEMVILLKTKEEKDHIINPDDPQHSHYRLPDNEIWIFQRGGVPLLTKFPPMAIKSVNGDQTNPQASQLEDQAIRKILADKTRFALEGEALDAACERTVTLQLWDKLIEDDGTCPQGVIDSLEGEKDPLSALNEEALLLNHKVLIEPPPPTVDEIGDMDGMKDRLRDSIDTLFIKVKNRLGRILTQINALEYRVCALEECDAAGIQELDLPQDLKELKNMQPYLNDEVLLGATATEKDKPTNF